MKRIFALSTIAALIAVAAFFSMRTPTRSAATQEAPRQLTRSQEKIISSPVAFTALGMRTSAYRDPGVAELMLSTELLGNVVLHREIREKGGAYGGGAFMES